MSSHVKTDKHRTFMLKQETETEAEDVKEAEEQEAF
jgi:hypothetical protein